MEVHALRKLFELLAVLLGTPLLAVVIALLTRRYTDAQTIQYLEQNALLATGIGLALIGVILASEALGKRNFELLWYLFVPLLWLTLGTTMLLMLLHASLLLHMTWALLGFLGRTLSGLSLFVTGVGCVILGCLMIGTAAGTVNLAWALLRTFRRHRRRITGEKATEANSPALWALVRSIAERLGCEPPAQIVLLLEPDFYVTETAVWLDKERLKGRTMALSLSAMRLLTEGELAAIIAHEMAHLRARDTRLIHRYGPILHRSRAILRGLVASTHSSLLRALGLIPTIAVLQFFHDAFTRASSHDSRRREFLADAAGLQVVSPVVVGAGLVKIHAAAETWGDVMRQFFDGGRRFPIENGATRFAALARQAATPEHVSSLTEKAAAHPFDTHPTLQERLTALDLNLEAASADLVWEPQGECAINLVAGAEEVEQALTRRLYGWVEKVKSRGWRIA